MELRKIWETIGRRKWIIIQAFLVISLSAIIGSYLLTPVYEATTKILIKRPEPELYMITGIGLRSPEVVLKDLSMIIEDHIELVVARPVLDKVISRLQLKDRNGDFIKPDVLRDYTFFIYELFPRPCVQVEVVEEDEMETTRSNQIEITGKATDPEEAAMIANTLAEEYIDRNLRRKKEQYKAATAALEKQIDAAKAKYIKGLEDIKTFAIAENAIDVKAETTEAVERMFEVMKEKEDNIRAIAGNRARIKELKGQLNRQDEEKVSSSTISESAPIEQIKRTIVDLQVELEGELVEKKPDHPDVVMLHQKLNKAKEELRKEIDLIKVFSGGLEDLERELASLEAHGKSLDKEIDQYMVEYNAMAEKIFGDSQLQLDYEVNRSTYNSLLTNLNQIALAESIIFPDVQLVEAAEVPESGRPVSPNMGINSIVGIGLGLLFGFGLGFLVEYVDDRVQGVGDVQRHGVAILGSVPRTRGKKRVLILERDPQDHIAESYRMIRNSIKFFSEDRPLKTVLIASAAKGEGRSTVVVNLGITFARGGKKVLIVDTDFRHPRLDQIMGVSNPGGMSNILSENAVPQDVIEDIENIEGLSLLAGGSAPFDPYPMIESDKMRQLISDLSRQYDVVLLDSSPLLLSNDAIGLAKYSDTIILVLESGRISLSSFSRIIEHLKDAKIHLTGVILNKLPRRRRTELF